MAQNFIQPGEHLEITNGGNTAIASGAPVKHGSIVGVALGIIPANGGKGTIRTTGVFQLPKKANLVINSGDAVFWDSTPGEITKTATDGFFIGYAVAGALGAATTVNVLLVQEANGAQAANVAQNATANGSDAGTTQALANSLKTSVNAILTSLKNAGIMEQDA
jgi:predicted RecA/RadA family phage recombinase